MKRVSLFLLLILLCQPMLVFSNSILVLGDSLSAGYGLSKEQGWVSLLDKKLKHLDYQYTVINASISGDTTGNGLNRLPNLLKKDKPSVVILMLGGNDGLRGFGMTQIKSNLEKMIQLSLKAKANVLLVGVTVLPNYGELYKKRFMAIYVQLAKKYSIALVPNLFASIKNNTQLLQSDGIHLSAKAQPLLLNLIWKKLKPLLVTG